MRQLDGLTWKGRPTEICRLRVVYPFSKDTRIVWFVKKFQDGKNLPFQIEKDIKLPSFELFK